jgi:hypothetical protein
VTSTKLIVAIFVENLILEIIVGDILSIIKQKLKITKYRGLVYLNNKKPTRKCENKLMHKKIKKLMKYGII